MDAWSRRVSSRYTTIAPKTAESSCAGALATAHGSTVATMIAALHFIDFIYRRLLLDPGQQVAHAQSFGPRLQISAIENSRLNLEYPDGILQGLLASAGQSRPP